MTLGERRFVNITSSFCSLKMKDQRSLNLVFVTYVFVRRTICLMLYPTIHDANQSGPTQYTVIFGLLFEEVVKPPKLLFSKEKEVNSLSQTTLLYPWVRLSPLMTEFMTINETVPLLL